MTSPNPLRAVLFDLDGTLIATGPEIALAVNDTLEELSFPVIPDATVETWVGHGAHDLLTSVLAHTLALPRDAVPEWPQYSESMALFRQHYATRTGTCGQLYDGVLPALERFQADCVGMAVVTNKDTEFAKKALAAVGIEHFFPVLVCGDTLPTRKPDPEGVNVALKKLGVAASEAVFIGDSGVDVQTARNAGLRVWAFSRGYNWGRPIREAGPDVVFDDWVEVLGLAGR